MPGFAPSATVAPHAAPPELSPPIAAAFERQLATLKKAAAARVAARAEAIAMAATPPKRLRNRRASDGDSPARVQKARQAAAASLTDGKAKRSSDVGPTTQALLADKHGGGNSGGKSNGGGRGGNSAARRMREGGDGSAGAGGGAVAGEKGGAAAVDGNEVPLELRVYTPAALELFNELHESQRALEAEIIARATAAAAGTPVGGPPPTVPALRWDTSVLDVEEDRVIYIRESDLGQAVRGSLLT